MIRTRQYQLIELQVNNALGAGQRLYFQDQAQLRSQTGQNVFIAAVSTYSADLVPNSFLSANVTAPTTEIQNAAIVLNVAGREQEQLIPLVELLSIQSPGTFQPNRWDLFLFNDLITVDWTKSYIQVAAATAATPFSFLFGIWYDYQPYFSK